MNTVRVIEVSGNLKTEIGLWQSVQFPKKLDLYFDCFVKSLFGEKR